MAVRAQAVQVQRLRVVHLLATARAAVHRPIGPSAQVLPLVVCGQLEHGLSHFLSRCVHAGRVLTPQGSAPFLLALCHAYQYSPLAGLVNTPIIPYHQRQDSTEAMTAMSQKAG